MSTAKCVLTIDDSKTIREMLAHTLSTAGYTVVSAEDGQKGLAAARKHKPEIIITDVNMPVMDGITFIREFRTDPANGSTPVLVLTTERSAEIKNKGRAAGATGWIVKPFDPAVLLKTLRKVSP